MKTFIFSRTRPPIPYGTPLRISHNTGRVGARGLPKNLSMTRVVS